MRHAYVPYLVAPLASRDAHSSKWPEASNY
jgi:hypothetical protein